MYQILQVLSRKMRNENGIMSEVTRDIAKKSFNGVDMTKSMTEARSRMNGRRAFIGSKYNSAE